MEDMERGLSEMAQSVEHMQEMLKRSPMVQALAQHKPEVRARSALLRDQENMTFFLHKASRGYPVQQVSSPPKFSANRLSSRFRESYNQWKVQPRRNTGLVA